MNTVRLVFLSAFAASAAGLCALVAVKLAKAYGLL